MGIYQGRVVTVLGSHEPERLVTVAGDGSSSTVPLLNVRLTADERKKYLDAHRKSLTEVEDAWRAQDKQDAEDKKISGTTPVYASGSTAATVHPQPVPVLTERKTEAKPVEKPVEVKPSTTQVWTPDKKRSF